MWDHTVEAELYDIFTSLLRINSSNPPGNESEVCEYISSILKKEGIESQILSKEQGRGNLVATLEGGDGMPIILLSHTDVVDADIKQWKFDPFAAVNDGGVIYGRGALDTKQLTAMQLIAMILLKREGITLSAPVILVASADEEKGSTYGMEYMEAMHKELLPNSAVISEGGGFVLTQDDKKYRTCTCGEKGHCNITVELFSESNLAEYMLDVLGRLSGYTAPETLCGPSRRFMDVAPPPHSDTTLRNLWQYSTRSCLAIDAFDISFADKQEMQLKITFQFLPGTSQNEIETLIKDLLEGSNASFRVDSFSDGYECDMENPLYKMLVNVTAKYDPGVEMLPILALGRTDGRFIRENVYGYSPILEDIPFSQVLKKVHQADECITEASLYFGGRVLSETIRSLLSSDNSEK